MHRKPPHFGLRRGVVRPRFRGYSMALARPLMESLEPRMLLNGGPANIAWPLLQLMRDGAALSSTPLSGRLQVADEQRACDQLLAFDEAGNVLVDIWTRVEPESVADGLTSLGFESITISGTYHLLEGTIPVSSLSAAAEHKGVLSITPVYQPLTRAGSVATEGDAVHNADDVRLLDPAYDGTGVKVGVLSDSAHGLGYSQATGDLPAYVERLLDFPASDEGRAMLEIIHDLAPGAELAFRSGLMGEADFAQGIRDLAAAGADVIVDDVIFPSEPFFQDGIIAQAVDEVAAQSGVFYVAAAGNEGLLSYEGTFTDDGTGLHDFDPTAGIDTYQTITIPSPGAGQYYPLTLSLQWDQPFYTIDGVVSDFDVFVYDATGTTLIASATSANVATQQPLEVVSWDGQETTYAVAIRHVSGAADALLKYVLIGPDGSAIAEYATDSPTVYGHPAAAGAMAVGAVPHDSPDAIESFSSRGPTTILFDADGTSLGAPEVRQKPDVVAVNGVTTTVSGFAPFSGTSAAAPHVAGVAALTLSVNPHLEQDELYAVLTESAVDLGDPGPDAVYGFGRVDALAAQSTAASVIDMTGPVLRDISPDPTLGWRTDELTVWFSEALDPVTAGNPGHYEVREAGADAVFGTPDDTVYALTPTLSASQDVVLLACSAPAGGLPYGTYRLSLAAGITDPAGNGLGGGTGDGHDFVISPEPPAVATRGPSQYGAAVTPDGSLYLAQAYNPTVQTWEWPQARITRYDANGHLLGPSESIPTLNDAFDMYGADIAMDAAGGAVVWADHWYNGSPDTFDIRVQPLDAAGRPVGGSISLGSVDGDLNIWPHVAVCDDGFMVVTDVYTYDAIEGGGAGLRAWFLDRSGNILARDVDISGYLDSVETYGLSTDGSGTFVVVWGDPSEGAGVFARRYDEAGNEIGPTIPVTVGTGHNAAAVSMASDGSFVVAWGSRARRFDATGQPVTDAVRFDNGQNWEASVATFDDGRFVVAWRARDADVYGTYFQRVAADGTPVGGVGRMHDATGGKQDHPAVLAAAGGRFLLRWRDTADGTYRARWCEWDSVLPATGRGPWVRTVETILDGGAVAGWRFTFDRAIDPATFTVEDVLGKSPTGWSVSLRGTDPIVALPDGCTFEVYLASSASVAGRWWMEIGPGILDLAGNPMNQDGNGVNGEDADVALGEAWVPAVPATSMPVIEGFEAGSTGALDGYWSFATVDEGNVWVQGGSSHSGGYHLRMDQSGTSSASREYATLHLDLADYASCDSLLLTLWAKALGSYYYSQGHVSVRDDAHDWYQVDSYSSSSHYGKWVYHAIDLDAAIVAGSLSCAEDFQIRFEHTYGPGTSSRWLWDDIRVTPDAQPPGILSCSPGHEAILPQGDVTWAVVFDEPIDEATLGLASFSLTGARTGTHAPSTWDYEASSQTLSITYAGLPVDSYEFRLEDTIADAFANRLDGDGNGQAGGDYVASCTVALAGDLNLDGAVDAADYIALKQGFGADSGAAWSIGDLDGDSDVDWSDLQTLKAIMGASLPAAQAGEMPASDGYAEAESTGGAPASAEKVLSAESPGEDDQSDLLAIAASLHESSGSSGRARSAPSTAGLAHSAKQEWISGRALAVSSQAVPILSLRKPERARCDLLDRIEARWFNVSTGRTLPDDRKVLFAAAGLVECPIAGDDWVRNDILNHPRLGVWPVSLRENSFAASAFQAPMRHSRSPSVAVRIASSPGQIRGPVGVIDVGVQP